MPSGRPHYSPPAFILPGGTPVSAAVKEIEDGSPPPDVFRAWRAFTDALGTHLPARINRAQNATAAIRRLR